MQKSKALMNEGDKSLSDISDSEPKSVITIKKTDIF